MDLLKALQKYLLPHYKRILLIAVNLFLFVGTKLFFIPLVKDFAGDISQGFSTQFRVRLLEAFILLIVHCLAIYGRNFHLSYLSQKVIIDLRLQAFQKLQLLSMDFFQRWKTGEIMSRLSNDLNALEQGLQKMLVEYPTQIVVLIGVLIYMFFLNWMLLATFFIIIPFYILITNYFAGLSNRLTSQIQRYVGNITSMMQENIYGMSAIKAFVQEGEQFRKFENENYRNFNFSIKRLRIMELQQPLLIFMQWTFIFVLIGIGGVQMINGQLDVKDFLAFITAMVLIAEPVYILSNITLTKENSLVALRRVNEILEQIPSVSEPKTPVPLLNPSGEIEFKDLSFHYPNHTDMILKKVNLKVVPNSLLAIVGPSGAGKTTLVNLIPRFYDATAGEILLDGQNIKNYHTANLRKHIGIVSQETILFSGSIRENIAFGKPDATQEEIEQAAKYAHVDEFVQLFPSKYATLIGERGVRLSGGQKQRISIARAILKNPKILILDEATSSLDSHSEKMVQEALDHLMKNRTTIVIAHRLSTIKNANQILLLNKGVVEAVAPHDELLKTNETYRNLYETQFAKK